MGPIQRGKRMEKANSVSSLTIYDQQKLTTQPDGKNAHRVSGSLHSDHGNRQFHMSDRFWRTFKHATHAGSTCLNNSY